MPPFPAVAVGKDSVKDLTARCEEARSLSRYEDLDSLSSLLITNSTSNADRHTQTYAYFYNGLAKLFLGQTQQAQQMLLKAEDLSVAVGNDSVRALVMNAQGIYQAMILDNNFVAQQYFFRSMDLAEKSGYRDLYYRVKGNLLTLSHTAGDSIAYANALDVYNYGREQKNDEQVAMGAYYLATYYYMHSDYVQTEKFIRIALDTYSRYPYQDIPSVYILFAKMLIVRHDYSKARETVLKAIDLAHEYNQLSLEVEARLTYAELLNGQGEYRKSIDMIQKAMADAERIGVSSKIIDCNQLLARNWMALGCDREALQCLLEANRLLHGQSTINMERLSHEQKIMRDMEQKETEARLRQEELASQRQTLLLLTILVAALILLLVFIISSYRRRQILYRKIVLRNTRISNIQEEMRQEIERLTKALEAQQQGEAHSVAEKEHFALGDEKIDLLYNKLCRLMDSERLYAEAQLTRERMAERLGTNRTYLTKVIKEKTGMNYLQFINSYRINEAIRILSDRENINYPLKQIWSDLGFSSPSTFFKLFQQAVGITPSMYRKQFLEVKDEEEAAEDSIV